MYREFLFNLFGLWRLNLIFSHGSDYPGKFLFGVEAQRHYFDVEICFWKTVFILTVFKEETDMTDKDVLQKLKEIEWLKGSVDFAKPIEGEVVDLKSDYEKDIELEIDEEAFLKQFEPLEKEYKNLKKESKPKKAKKKKSKYSKS